MRHTVCLGVGRIILQWGQTNTWQKRLNNANALRRLMQRLFCVVTWACITVAELSPFYYHAYTVWLVACSEQILLAASLSPQQNDSRKIGPNSAPLGFVFELKCLWSDINYDYVFLTYLSQPAVQMFSDAPHRTWWCQCPLSIGLRWWGCGLLLWRSCGSDSSV